MSGKTTSKGTLVSVVVPVYNNAESLAETCSEVLKVHADEFPDLGLEIVFVNDGSKDGSWAELERLRRNHPQVRTIQLSRNFGQLGALFAGFYNARGDAIISISADLQDPASLMGEMVKHWRNGIEIVVCYRQAREDGALTRFFSDCAYAVARLTYPELPPGGFDYWLMSRRVCRILCHSYKGRHNFLQGYVLATGFSKLFIPYVRRQRKFGKSGHTLMKKIQLTISLFVESSYLPIQAMSVLGALTSFAGVIYSLMIIFSWYFHHIPFPGWAPIMIMQMLIGGVIMIMLGTIGEYLWRIYDNIRDYPLFIVDDAEQAGEDICSNAKLSEGASKQIST